MTTINTYLTFGGNCEEAFNFYRTAFGGEFSSISRFGEMPPSDKMPQMPESMKDRIMHVSLPISKETVLMGSDNAEGMGQPLVVGNNFSISIHMGSKEEADQMFTTLSEGGKVLMPMSDTFWEAYFGMLTDKFGINWMINVELGENKMMS